MRRSPVRWTRWPASCCGAASGSGRRSPGGAGAAPAGTAGSNAARRAAGGQRARAGAGLRADPRRPDGRLGHPPRPADRARRVRRSARRAAGWPARRGSAPRRRCCSATSPWRGPTTCCTPPGWTRRRGRAAAPWRGDAHRGARRPVPRRAPPGDRRHAPRGGAADATATRPPPTPCERPLLPRRRAGRPGAGARRVPTLRSRHRRRLPAARRPARRLRRSGRHRQTRRRRPQGGQADPSCSRSPWSAPSEPVPPGRPAPSPTRSVTPSWTRTESTGRGRCWSSWAPCEAVEQRIDRLVDRAAAAGRRRADRGGRAAARGTAVAATRRSAWSSTESPAPPTGRRERPSRAAPTTWSSSAPGWPGCPPRCTCSVPGAGSRSSSATSTPAAAPGGSTCTPRPAATGWTPARPCSRCPGCSTGRSRRSARSSATDCDLVELDPAYRARFADGSTIDVHTDGEAMEAEIRAVCGPVAAAGYRRLRDVADRGCTAPRSTRFIGANLDSPLDLLGPDLVRLAALGGFGRLGPRIARMLPDERLQRIFSFQSLYAGVAPQHALGRLRRDRLHGHGRPGCCSRAAACAPWARRWPTPPLAAGAEHPATDARRPGWSARRPGDRAARAPSGEAPGAACDAVVLTPDLPWCTGCSAARRGGRCRCAGPRARSCCTPGPPRSWPELAHHTISFGEAWRPHVPRDHPRGSADERPVAAGHPADRHRPVARPAGPRALVRAGALPEHRRGPIDWRRVGPAYRDELVRSLEARAASTGSARRSRSSGGHPGRLGGDRPRRRHAVLRRAHVRPDRAVPAAEPGAAGWRTWCWPAAAPHLG